MDYALNWKDLDKDERALFSLDAYDVILLENATEVFRKFAMNDPEDDEATGKHLIPVNIPKKSKQELPFFEYILYKFSQLFPDVTYLDSETFPDLDDEDYEDRVDSYRRRVVKPRIGQRLNMSLQSSPLTSGTAGGHYAAAMFDNVMKEALFFDSMQFNPRGGPYTEYFQKLVSDIFGVNAKAPECAGEMMAEYSLQLTGRLCRESTPGCPSTKGKSW